MIELFDDQKEFMHGLRKSLATHQSVLGCAPPGFGKTVVAAAIFHGSYTKRRRAIFVCHRKELLRQTAKTLDKFGIPYGLIAAGRPANPFASIQVATLGTIINRMSRYPADLIVADEAHLSGSPTWVRLIDHYKSIGAKVIGLSGSPERPDGKPLSMNFEEMVSGPPTSWLIDNGRLARYKAYAPVMADLSKLKIASNGDFTPASMGENFDKPSIIGDAVKSWGTFARGMRTAIYAFSVEHSKHVSQTFTANGIRIDHMDGTTHDDDRKKIIMDFAMGRSSGISSCDLMTTGFDLSSQVDMDVPIQCGVFLRPTKSLPLATQMLMRPMRRQDGYAALIDHVNLFRTHGFPDDDHDWDWQGINGKGARGGETTIPTVQCASCMGTHRPAPRCPYCGAIREVGEGREVEQVDGDLEEIDPETERLRKNHEFVARKIEERECKTLEDWVRLAKKRGHKPGWAYYMHKVKNAKKAATR